MDEFLEKLAEQYCQEECLLCRPCTNTAFIAGYKAAEERIKQLEQELEEAKEKITAWETIYGY